MTGASVSSGSVLLGLVRAGRWLLASVAAVGVGCSASNPSGADVPTREELLESLATTVYVPAFDEFQARAASLAVTVQALCDDPAAAGLQAAQDAWFEARLPLKRAEAWAFGPIEDQGIDAAIDFWPVRPDAVEATIALGEAPTPAWVAALGSASKGLPVIEYLLFDPVGGSAAVLARLDPQTPEGPYRCAVAAALAQGVATRAAELHAAWDPAGGGFATRLSANGDDSPGNPSLQMAISDVVNGLATSLQNVTDTKMGRPLGNRSGGTPQPDDVESRFSDHDRAELLANLSGVEQVYLGRTGVALTDVVAPLDAALDTAIREQLGASRAALEGLPAPLRLAVVDDPAPVDAARDVVRDLRRLIEVDLSALLGINISLNDNDGD